MSRTQTDTYEVYTLDELTGAARDRALSRLAESACDYEWWDGVYGDAERVGITITSFDLDRNRNATSKILDCKETAYLIVDNHGTECETYKTAAAFIEAYDRIVESYPLDEDGERSTDQERDMDYQLDDLEDQFCKDITEDYSIILQHEYEYQTSEEQLIENAAANGYEFTENGDLI